MGKVRKKDEGRERAIRKSRRPPTKYAYRASHADTGWESSVCPNYPRLFQELVSHGILDEGDLMHDIQDIRSIAESKGVVFRNLTWDHENEDS
jgi:hypothetical protein